MTVFFCQNSSKALNINAIVYFFLSVFLVFLAGDASAKTIPSISGQGDSNEITASGEAKTGQDKNELMQEMQLPAGDSGNYLSSKYARSSGNVEQALGYLRSIHKKNADNMEVSSQLLGMLMIAGNMDEAIALAGDIREKNSKDAVAGLLLALGKIKQNDLEGAAASLENDFEDSSGQLWLPLVSGWVAAGREKLEKPIKIEELTANVGHAAPIVNYHLALINNQAGFKEEAAQNFLAAIDDAKNPPTRMMEMLLAFYDASNSPKVLEPLVLGYRAAHPVEAENKTSLLATPAQGVSEVLFTMGSIMQAAGLAQDSVIYFQMANYLRSDLAVAQMALAESYAQLQLYKHSSAVYEKIPVDTRFYTKARLNIAINLDRMGKLNEALAMLDALAMDLPNSEEALITRGDLLRIHKRFHEAIDSYTEAFSAADSPSANAWAIYFARGGCFERIGKWPQAEADLRKSLELFPDQPDVLNYLGYGMLARGENIEEAKSLIEKAIEKRPDDPAIIDSMGWALFLSGDYEAAADYVERAAELSPSDATIYDHLGDIYWRLGRKTEARYQWQRSLSYSPEPTLVSSVNKKLKNGLPQLADSKPRASVKAEIDRKHTIEE